MPLLKNPEPELLGKEHEGDGITMLCNSWVSGVPRV